MSEIKVDTLKGAATSSNVTVGSTPLVSASANSLTIRGEGSAQTSIQQGLAKWWVNADGNAAAVQGSFNNSAFVDDGNGSSYTFTNNMSDTVYCAPSGGHFDDTNRTSMYFSCFNNLATTGVKCNTGTYSTGNVGDDIDLIYAAVFGDLA